MNEARSLLTSTLVILLSLASGVIASDFEPMSDKMSIENQPATAHEGTPADAADHRSVSKAAPARSAAAILAAFDEAARNNAVIELEAIHRGTVPWALPDPVEVAALWNSGQHNQALLALRQLESAGFNFIPAISWKVPLESHQKRYYQDVRIGGTRTVVQTLDLDYAAGESTIFALTGWADDWTMNVSFDRGLTWQETYNYSSQAEVSMAVCGNYVWVAYSPASIPDEVRMRRFHTSTGATDSVYFFETVKDIGPETVVDIALISNEPDVSTAVYVGIVASDNSVRTYWDDLTGTSFSTFSPPVTNADDNIDFTYAPNGISSSGYVAYLSYESTTGDIVVWRMSFLGTWDQVRSRPITGSNNYTSISAFKDTVMIAYEYAYADGNGIRYDVSYNYGTDWLYGDIYEPAFGDPLGYGAAVSLSGGNGCYVTYHLEEGATDSAYVRARPRYDSYPWNSPIRFSNHDTMSGTETKIEWIGTLGVSSHGMLYRGDGGIPYFDLTAVRAFFFDGFESGNTSAWD